MDHFDDRPLERAPDPAGAPEPAPPPSRATPIIVIAMAGLLLGGAGAWWWIRASRAPEATAPAVTQGTEALVPAAAEPPRPLPALGQMDTFLRALLGTLSAHPDFVRWLATDQLIRQMASVIDRVSRGLSPAPVVAVLRPQGDFEVAGRGPATITAASFRRYDGLAAIVESLNAKAVVESYRTIQPRLDEAYRALGRSDAGVDQAVDVALQTLIDTPLPAEPVRVIPGSGATFAYADGQTEQLLPVQKQLLRMGPDNVRRIQTRLREIQSALR